MQNVEDELIRRCLEHNEKDKIISVPLDFAYLPVDILTKQFTKLNSPHQHRIHYLGPRYANTQTMHKKCVYTQGSPLCRGVPDRKVNKYRVDLKRIANSFFINEKLRNNQHYKSGVYYRAFEGMNPTLDLTKPQYIFHGEFESANLDCVIQYKPREFDLFLRIDSNTRGHLQWFYFSIQNGAQLQKIKLNICNMLKSGTLYELEMQPYVFSKKAFEKRQQYWMQGHGISMINFSQKAFNYNILAEKVNMNPFCLSFQYEFEFQHDEVFFAYCIPYTYSQLLLDIDMLPQQFTRIYSLGRTISGLQIPLLHITDHHVNNPNKRNIIITGRIHPGQSNGSHTLKGFTDFLCNSKNSSATELRRSCNFFIVPMLNPDGVVLGNSRCSISGRDLNRMFPQTDKQLFPEIHYLKLFTARFLNNKQILMYFDFHGHSRKKNTFFYGPSFPLSSPNFLKCRVLPRIIQKINCCFRYYSCMFAINQTKKSTGRAAMFENFRIPFTYTVQSSIGFYYDCQQMKSFPFTKQAYLKMGAAICQGTSTFITAYNQYQNFLKQRRASRQRKRDLRTSSQFRKTFNQSTKFDQEQTFQMPRSHTLKLSYKKQNEQCLFLKLLEQVKKMPQSSQQIQKQQSLDKDASSDDHDEKQDLQETKLKEFSNLISRNSKKDNFKSKEQQLDDEVNSFVRSNNLFENGNYTMNQINLQKEQLQLFEERNISFKPKPNTSQGTRRKEFSKSPQGRLRINILKKNNQNFGKNLNQESNQIERYENNQKYFKSNFIQNEQAQSQKLDGNANYMKSAIRFKNNKQRRKAQQAAHYSEIQFPEYGHFEKKQLLKHQKTDLFRKTLDKRREQKSRLQSLNCSQITIIKHPKKQLSQYENLRDKRKRVVEFKMDDLLINLECRSKAMQDSVRFKDQRKFKVRSNTMFPSSFYGMKQQINAKKKPSEGRDSQLIVQQMQDLTVKTFYKV